MSDLQEGVGGQSEGACLSAPGSRASTEPSGLGPSGFDPSRIYEEFKLPDWCIGRIPVISRERAVHRETLRRLVDRLDVAGDHEAADTIVWLMWWRNIADNRAQFMAEFALRDSDGSGEAGETVGLDPKGDSAGRDSGIAQDQSHDH